MCVTWHAIGKWLEFCPYKWEKKRGKRRLVLCISVVLEVKNATAYDNINQLLIKSENLNILNNLKYLHSKFEEST
jgi:hypothetical protein